MYATAMATVILMQADSNDKIIWLRISKQINVTSDEPQGSHLGPLLFILFMNDVQDILKISNV